MSRFCVKNYTQFYKKKLKIQLFENFLKKVKNMNCKVKDF